MKGTAMTTAKSIATMSDDEVAALQKEIARKLAFRVAGIVFFKVAATRILNVLANRSYQSSVTEH
jgi:hypothetical protein